MQAAVIKIKVTVEESVTNMRYKVTILRNKAVILGVLTRTSSRASGFDAYPRTASPVCLPLL